MTEKEVAEELEIVINAIVKLITYINKVASLGTKIEYKIQKEKIPIKIKSDFLKQTFEATIIIDEIRKNIESKLKYKVISNCILYNNNYYENFISDRFFDFIGYRDSPTDRDQYYQIKDTKNKIEYEISSVSNELMILILLNLIPTADDVPRRIAFNFIYPLMDTYWFKEKESINLFNIFRSNQLSLKIRTAKSTTINTIKNLASSFSYNIAFYRDRPLILTKDLTKVYKEEISSFRSEEIQVPKKLYNEEITYYYLMAANSRIPFLQYLLYYQIIEYYYAKVYNENIVKFISNRISDPDFNHSSDIDIRNFINDLGENFRIPGDKKLDEKDALKMTLKRYVDKKNLANKLSSYDKELINHYKTHVVSFAIDEPIDSNTTLIDFKKEDHVIGNLTRRIYAIRNSIVHSKDISEARFKPFVDEEELTKEIPLIRLIAEEVIHNSASKLEL